MRVEKVLEVGVVMVEKEDHGVVVEEEEEEEEDHGPVISEKAEEEVGLILKIALQGEVEEAM